MLIKRALYVGSLIFLLGSCASYYQKNEVLMDAVYRGQYQLASTELEQAVFKDNKRNELLYYLNKGTVLFMNNKEVQSNQYFQQADYFVEDYQKNYLRNAATYLSNPTLKVYEGESFEKVLLHYFTTLNYLKQGKLDEALVETKRMQLKLTKITDYYKGKNKYQNDAFVYLLSGLVYDAQGEYNNAFIAYRNAFDIYTTVYTKELNTTVPLQLKEDLIRTALLTGFIQEAEQYKKMFSMQGFNVDSNFKNSALIFWNNGFGPIKDQWSIDFLVTSAGNGWVNFYNANLGLNIPYFAGKDSKSYVSLKSIRIAFPKYRTRKPLFTYAQIQIDSASLTKPFFTAEPIDKIAYVSLNDRMVKEVSEAVVRFAVKQVTEMAASSKNEALGSALSIVNTLSEQADTRNWQTLPFDIQYTRVSLPAGSYSAQVVTNDQTKVPFTLEIKRGKTTFKIIQSPYFTNYQN